MLISGTLYVLALIVLLLSFLVCHLMVSVGQICMGDLSRETQAVSQPLNRLHLPLGSRGGGVLVYHHKLE